MIQRNELLATVQVNRQQGGLWAICSEYPDAYGWYQTESELQTDMRYQIRLSLMDRKEDVPEEMIRLQLAYTN